MMVGKKKENERENENEKGWREWSRENGGRK